MIFEETTKHKNIIFKDFKSISKFVFMNLISNDKFFKKFKKISVCGDL